MKNRLVTFLIVVIGLLLSSCSQTIDITFWEDESWKVDTTINYDASSLKWVQDIIPELLESLELPFDLNLDVQAFDDALVESALETMVSYYGSQEINVTWENKSRGGQAESSYDIHLEGRSLDQFTALFPEQIYLNQVVEDEKSTYQLIIEIGEFNTFSRMLYKQDITLHAGEIIQSNAPKQKKNQALWFNPEKIDVDFVPKSKSWINDLQFDESTLLWICIPTAAIIILAGLTWYIVQNRSRSSARRSRTRPQNRRYSRQDRRRNYRRR